MWYELTEKLCHKSVRHCKLAVTSSEFVMWKRKAVLDLNKFDPTHEYLKLNALETRRARMAKPAQAKISDFDLNFGVIGDDTKPKAPTRNELEAKAKKSINHWNTFFNTVIVLNKKRREEEEKKKCQQVHKLPNSKN